VRVLGWRCVGDVGGALFFQAALARMPFADLMGILQMTPLSLTAASALFLGDGPKVRDFGVTATAGPGVHDRTTILPGLRFLRCRKSRV